MITEQYKDKVFFHNMSKLHHDIENDKRYISHN